MLISRRTALQLAGFTGLGFGLLELGFGDSPLKVVATGNPIIPNIGQCDPQVRVYDDHVYMYSTHDASADSPTFVMHDWWVWHSTDLVHWELVSTLKPEQTYHHQPSTQCWATDGARRNGRYFFYFSMGPEEIGVVEGPHPFGPWHDPTGHALIAKGQVKTESRDPGIFQEEDGTSYIVFGTFDYYIARLNEDMTSLAETPRLVTIRNPVGPYGKGRTDDKPFLHRRQDKYYFSWGCYYAISESPYGPYDCKGSIIQANRLAPRFLEPTNRTGPHAPPDWLGFDRHGSFFELYGQWYFVCNDQALPGSNTFFRNSVISYVRYKENGEIDPIRLTDIGVGQYDASVRIEASDFFKVAHARVAETSDGRFQVRDLKNGSSLAYPNIRNLRSRPRLTLSASSIHPNGVEIEIRRGNASGVQMARLTLEAQPNFDGDSLHSAALAGAHDKDDLCLVIKGGPGELVRLNYLEFS